MADAYIVDAVRSPTGNAAAAWPRYTAPTWVPMCCEHWWIATVFPMWITTT